MRPKETLWENTCMNQENKKNMDLEVNCFQCKKKILVGYNYPRKKYSDKNNWGYWTEKEENKDKWICNSCILNLYHRQKKEYWKLVTSKKKRTLMRGYISNKSFDKK